MVTFGTVVCSDGIVATSTDCLRHLKGTEYKVMHGRKILEFQLLFKFSTSWGS